MSRLIDVGKVMEELKVIYERDHTAKVDIGSMICLIGEQPTAYDVDKVVEEVNYSFNEANWTGDIGREEIIDIVKRGK